MLILFKHYFIDRPTGDSSVNTPFGRIFFIHKKFTVAGQIRNLVQIRRHRRNATLGITFDHITRYIQALFIIIEVDSQIDYPTSGFISLIGSNVIRPELHIYVHITAHQRRFHNRRRAVHRFYF